MADVLIYADSLRSPEMRHEVPIAIPDPFLYAERDGERSIGTEQDLRDRVTIELVAPSRAHEHHLLVVRQHVRQE